MKLFDCKVRLSGSLYNEVPKLGVTAPEIQLLRHLHGGDAIVEIYEAGKNATTQSEERERLLEVYGEGIIAQQRNKTSPSQALAEIFGVSGRLPDTVDGALKPKDKPKAAAPVAEEAEAETNLEEA